MSSMNYEARVCICKNACIQSVAHSLWQEFPIFCPKIIYRISSYSFRGNYSFLDLEIQRSQYIRPKVTVHKGAETIQGRKLFKGGNYMRKYGKAFFPFLILKGKYDSCPIHVVCFILI